VISSFTLSWLAPAVRLGYTTEALFSATSSTSTASSNVAAVTSNNIDRIGASKASSDAVFDIYTASALPVTAYTATRRFERNRLTSLGVDGIYTDDPAYTSVDVPIATEDNFDAGRWMPGMLAVGESLTEDWRGRILSDGSWGRSTFTPVEKTRLVLQGWACPVVPDPLSDEFSIEFTAQFFNANTDTRFMSLFLSDASMVDREA
jgi:hypothetical protein